MASCTPTHGIVLVLELILVVGRCVRPFEDEEYEYE